MIQMFLEEKDIKMKQNYILNLVFNRSELHNYNQANLK